MHSAMDDALEKWAKYGTVTLTMPRTTECTTECTMACTMECTGGAWQGTRRCSLVASSGSTYANVLPEPGGEKVAASAAVAGHRSRSMGL